MVTGVITLDMDGSVTTINPAARRILGLADDGLVGAPYRAVVHAEANPDVAAAIAAVLTTAVPQELYERPLTPAAARR